jgi:predicted nucleic acid-binding protein
VKLVVREAESAALAQSLAGDQLVSSTLAWAEVVRAVPSALRPVATRLLDGLGWVQLSEDVVRSAGLLEPRPLRTLDALHVATALRLGSAIGGLVCYDRRLAAAAADHGLAVVAPA